LGRLVKQFGPFWPVLLIVLVLILGNTYIQVLSPELVGQSVDCYLTPATTSRMATSISAGQMPAAALAKVQGAATTNCWYATSFFGGGAMPANSMANDYVRGLGGLILLILALYVVGSIMGGLQFYLMSWAGQHVLKGLRVKVFNHLHELSLSYYAENEAGAVMSRITNDMDTLQQAISFVLVNVTSGGLLIVWIAFNMLRKSVPYALISMTVIPFMVIATVWFSGQARRAFRRTRVAIGNVNADLQESIAGVREVQAFGREEANIESFRQANAANRDANIRAVAFTAALSPTLEALGYLAIAITTIVGGIALLRGQTLFGTVISLGLVITFLQYVQRFNQPIQQISVMWTNLQSAVAGAERIFGLLDTVAAVQDKPNAQPMPAIVGRVEFDHVHAAYKAGEPVLCGVSFAAGPGQTIAIVGPTGAGKTTIINLIPRFYDVTGGAVRIDGVDVRDVQMASLRRQIGLVLQDTFLFSDTVINNIRFGRPDASDEEVVAAARLAHADDFIQRLPAGYNTLLGERGSGLSQGQRQLIAIARAALADPRILILDEATSSVDTRTERQIQKALDELLKSRTSPSTSLRTSFVIAHRLSTIRNADQVLVLMDGEIVERGKHDELLARRGAFYELYMKQFRREEGVDLTLSSVADLTESHKRFFSRWRASFESRKLEGPQRPENRTLCLEKRQLSHQATYFRWLANVIQMTHGSLPGAAKNRL
jgi:ATP-binding cassette subfamily B protein